MDKFVQYLDNKRIVNAKIRSFYAHWVQKLYKFIHKRHGEPLLDTEIEKFLASIGDTHHDWQVKQAEDAIRLYLYFQSQSKSVQVKKTTVSERLWSDAIEQMVAFMRLKHLSYRTEQTYLSWMRQFYRYVRGWSPKNLESDHVIGFLTYLAVERKVAKATQNLAFNAVLFFFRHVLKQDIGALWKSMRAKKKQRLPVVLSSNEVQRLLEHVQGVHRLMIQLIYGGGLRSTECVRLRVKDIDCIAVVWLSVRLKAIKTARRCYRKHL